MQAEKNYFACVVPHFAASVGVEEFLCKNNEAVKMKTFTRDS